VCISSELLVGKLVRKNRPTQIIEFMVHLAGKCVEGMQMSWVNYVVNELEKDFCETYYLGYEFHYSWLIILIAFVAWNMPEGATFLEIEPTDPLTA
jgi:hypothetical protein